MRLCLGILNEDLADRFCISPALCSGTFTTWIRLLRQLLGHALVVWLPKEAVRQNLPNVFRKARYSNCRVILDCAEVFLERSKSLDNQAYTCTITVILSVCLRRFTFLIDSSTQNKIIGSPFEVTDGTTFLTSTLIFFPVKTSSTYF